jgi:hypothetical protein
MMSRKPAVMMSRKPARKPTQLMVRIPPENPQETRGAHRREGRQANPRAGTIVQETHSTADAVEAAKAGV